MESFKPKPLEERKSQKLNFWDFTKERLFWVALPFMTAGSAMLFGKITDWKVRPLDGSPDLVSYLYAKGTKILFKKHDLKGGEEIEQWLKKGGIAGGIIEDLGGDRKETLRKYYFNMVKGAEVATPFSAYFLWNKKEGNRLDLEQAGEELKTLQNLKPSDAELADHNEAMRRELEFAARTTSQASDVPAAIIDRDGMEYHGKLAEVQKQRT